MTVPVWRWLTREGLLVKAEFAVPWGICDLVGLSFKKEQVAKRLSLRQHLAIGPIQRIEILSHIPDKESGESITSERLQNLTGGPGFGSTFGRFLLYFTVNTPNRLWLLPLAGSAEDRKAVRIDNSEFNEVVPRFSPDLRRHRRGLQ
jgi:hypothetical protein